MKNIKYKTVYAIGGFFVFVFSVFMVTKSFTYYESSAEKQNEISIIDNKIEELEGMKRGYEAKALNHANQADRLQFMEGQLQTAKKHWKLADDNRRIATQIQKQIDELKIQKMDLQKRYQ